MGRFLVGRPRVGCLFEWQAHPSALHALADADWAGDRQSRKSVNGGMILHGKHLINGLDEAAKHSPKQKCALATVQQQSRWEFRRLPKTWVESFRFGCTLTPVQQSKAHRDPVPVAPGGGPPQQADGGEDPFGNKLF